MIDRLRDTMYEGEGLHAQRVYPDPGNVLVCRLDDHKLIPLASEGREVEATTDGH